uniref:Uncharacterized protein n=1 Tax=Oryza brachyantha TaxID=4533 RepID=J3MUZ7_ORYBR
MKVCIQLYTNPTSSVLLASPVSLPTALFYEQQQQQLLLLNTTCHADQTELLNKCRDRAF